jgi:hypothetical protein
MTNTLKSRSEDAYQKSLYKDDSLADAWDEHDWHGLPAVSTIKKHRLTAMLFYSLFFCCYCSRYSLIT